MKKITNDEQLDNIIKNLNEKIQNPSTKKADVPPVIKQYTDIRKFYGPRHDLVYQALKRNLEK